MGANDWGVLQLLLALLPPIQVFEPNSNRPNGRFEREILGAGRFC
jgi:hypothetical protein